MDLYIDDRGFLYADDFKLPCKLNLETGCLEFFDKDRIRSVAYGSRIRSVPVAVLATLADAPPHQKSELLKG